MTAGPPASEIPAAARGAAPWYVHPLEDPEAWASLLAGTDLAFAVVNAASGPDLDDAAYRVVLSQPARTKLVGYVNVDYGARPPADVLRDAQSWLAYPGVSGIMLDCVPVAPSEKLWNVGLIRLLRDLGAGLVIANPGTPPSSELVWEADVTCVAEYDWDAFQSWEPPEALAALPAERLWMLVHNVPPGEQQEALRMISRKGAAHGWATSGSLPNPWATLPARWKE